MRDATAIDQLSVSTIRLLAADAVRKAKSGHPGTTACCERTSRKRIFGLVSPLETYVCGQCDIIIDYATARRREEPISTAVTESTV